MNNGQKQLFQYAEPLKQKYDSISSVWERSDGELLEAMLSFYPTIKPEPILDATYNAGRFWKGSIRDVWSSGPSYTTRRTSGRKAGIRA